MRSLPLERQRSPKTPPGGGGGQPQVDIWWSSISCVMCELLGQLCGLNASCPEDPGAALMDT